MLKALRRRPVRFAALAAAVAVALLCLYYRNMAAAGESPAPAPLAAAGRSSAQGGPREPLPQQQPQQQQLQQGGGGGGDDREEDNEVLPQPPGAGGGEPPPALQPPEADDLPDAVVSRDNCPALVVADADVDTSEQFRKFEFQPYWMKSREYWDANFESRYKDRKEKWTDMPLKVVIVPHSHNDPGWLKTFESYYHYQTRNILNNMADKLPALRNMTFMWTEIAFFAQWWETAHPTKRRVVRRLLEEGRLEMTTAGWVMTDEATSHLYAMLDQLIEGHQWLKNNLGVEPRSGWSVDPFGHGSTVPYLLKAAGLGGAVIQRIHYAWKQWLAERQMGDFLWRQNWDRDGSADLLVHNQPFDIYSIKHSCGPHPQVCLNFDFRKIPGEYTEYSVRAVPIDRSNVRQKAELLLEQYGRTASLSPANLALIPLGDDFRYDRDVEWQQQYAGYSQLIAYINAHRDRYHAEVNFGTVSDYFDALRERSAKLRAANSSAGFPRIRGDFFVYSDIFSEGRPAYWSGYFTTRPYWKLLDRELEAALRSAEILYAVALAAARRPPTSSAPSNSSVMRRLLERDFERLVRARRSLALFQHHDAIAGTSKAFVMHDYALKLFEAIQDATQVTARAALSLLGGDGGGGSGGASIGGGAGAAAVGGGAGAAKLSLLPDTDRESYEKLPRKVPLVVPRNEPRRLVLWNSLAQQRQEVVAVRVTTASVRVLDPDGRAIPHQLNPVWNLTDAATAAPNPAAGGQDRQDARYSGGVGGESSPGPYLQMSGEEFELLFVADLAPLSLAVYTVERAEAPPPGSRAVVYCARCRPPPAPAAPAGQEAQPAPFEVRPVQAGDVQLENHRLKLLLDGRTGLLRAITRKATGRVTQCGLLFAAYPSAQFHSGAYLFMPDPNSREPEREILGQGEEGENGPPLIVITSGPIASELRTVSRPPSLIDHTARIYHAAGPLAEGVSLDVVVDLGAPPRNRETELFMRLVTDISNGDPPEFYSDLNGFSMQRRVKVERVGIEGNYFPATTAALVQDSGRRLTLLVNRAQGAAGWQPGWLEVMLDRRTLYDDSRGMGEGVVDNKRTASRYWLLLEELDPAAAPGQVTRLSLAAHHLSNALLYPPSLLVAEGPARQPRPQRRRLLLDRPPPCDVHLLTLRQAPAHDDPAFPSTSALMVLHRQGYDCAVTGSTVPRCGPLDATSDKAFRPGTTFRPETPVSRVSRVSLTGLRELPGPLPDAADLGAGAGAPRVRPMELAALNVTFAVV
ncbi:alpha-mannosidase 2 isoform X3 [Schistocerca cancellata]|nr:alpha-mannosidase 2 isoform X3 [Schistocerca cancellata]